jgi:dephospho-CoA kinase
VLLVGLTGGIGAGKSTVSAMLRERGAVIVDADQIARRLQSPGTPVVAAMAERFGAHIIGPDGSLDRAAVAAIVFGESPAARAALRDLNAIVHPAMQSEIDRQVDAQRHTDKVVVLDFPLLAENPRGGLDGVIVVDVDPEIAVRRLVESRGMDETDARRRVASQIDRAQRLAIATHVIDNGGDLATLARQVDEVWDALNAMRGDSKTPTTISE